MKCNVMKSNDIQLTTKQYYTIVFFRGKKKSRQSSRPLRGDWFLIIVIIIIIMIICLYIYINIFFIILTDFYYLFTYLFLSKCNKK